MTEHHYTHAELIAEAAHQYQQLTQSPNFSHIRSEMRTRHRRTDHLTAGDLDDAAKYVTDLVRGAADLSAWAIQLGDDGFEPRRRAIPLGDEHKPFAQLHIA